VVPDYDDDDIVEDYEEVSSDSGVRRVQSAQGGPVKRPGGRPATSAMPALPPDENAEQQSQKGKITKQSAKLIWIICIAITVLGVGAVAVDLIFDPLGRGKAPDDPAANNGQPAANRGGRTTPREILTEHQQKAVAYGIEVHKYRAQALGCRGYDLLRLKMKEMDKKFSTANETRTDDALWVEAWTAYYDAEYALELYFAANKTNRLDNSFTLVSDYRDREECEILEDDELEDPVRQRKQGVYQAVTSETKTLNNQKKKLTAFVVSANVLDKEEHKPAIDAAKAKFTAARDKQEFLPEDLEYVNRPPRGENEPPPYID